MATRRGIPRSLAAKPAQDQLIGSIRADTNSVLWMQVITNTDPHWMKDIINGDTPMGTVSQRFLSRSNSEPTTLLPFSVLFANTRKAVPAHPSPGPAMRSMDLPTAKDGFPIVDRHLRWRKSLFVMGPLAELEVGPVSRNISGARMAASRIITSPELRKTMNTSNKCKHSA